MTVASSPDFVLAEPEARYEGLPHACPECGSPGHLDRIDMGRRCQHESCTACGERWTVPMGAAADVPTSGASTKGNWTRTGLSERLAARHP